MESIHTSSSNAMDKLKQAWNENPIAVIGVASVALAAAGKFIDAVGSYQSKAAYSRQEKARNKRSR
jgi:hypothetical protein